MNKLLLRLVMLPSGLWRSLGADVEQLKAILSVRLMMDDRKPIAFGRQRQQKKDMKGASAVNVFISVMIGILYVASLALIKDRILFLTMFFSIFLVLLSLTLISDFSTVLFDTRDKLIIMPRPVSDRTIVLSRMLHIFIYLLRIVFPMSLPTWIFIGWEDGWQSALLFPFAILLLASTALFLTNMCYLLILKLANQQRFKEIVNYFQIAASIFMFGVLYLMPRAFNSDHAALLTVKDFAWMRFLPSYWLASCWSLIGFSGGLQGTIFYSLLAIVFPLACLVVLVKWLAPQFAKAIGGLDVENTVSRTTKTRNASRSTFLQKLTYFFNRGDEARAGFMMTWIQTSRSRSFKMRVYPSFAFVPIYFIYLISMKPENDIASGRAFHNMAASKYIVLMYMSGFVIMQAINYLSISDQYKAAWVYYATPVERPGHIMAGAFKAIWLKYFLPFFILLSGYIIFQWGVSALPDIVLGIVNVTLFAVIVARVTCRYLPFSLLNQMNQNGTRIFKSFLTTGLCGIIGVLHWVVMALFWVKMIFIILSAIFLWLVWDSYKNTNWRTLERIEPE